MKWRSALIALLSLALLAWLVRGVSWAPILDAVGRVGGGGFVALLMVQLLLALPAAMAWALLIRPTARLRFRTALWGRMVRDAAGQLLPFTAIGGGAIGAHVLTRAGLDRDTAAASTFLDLVVEFATQLLYIALGAVLLAVLKRLRPPAHWIVAGLAALAVLALVSVLIRGDVAARLWRTIGRKLVNGRPGSGLGDRLAQLKAGVAGAGRPGVLFGAGALHLAAWVLTGAQTWLMLRLLGVRLGLPAALAIDSLTVGARAAAFLIPSGVGVQEGAIVLLAQLFGVPPATGLALALVRRGRDLALAAPVLLAWQAGMHRAARPQASA